MQRDPLRLRVKRRRLMPTMGAIRIPVIVLALRGRRELRADFLVDTGATDCLVPAAALRKIGVRPVGKMNYELADGTAVEYEFGLVQFRFLGEVTAGRVIFGPDEAEPLLGVTALESVGIIVDPVNQTLKRLPAIPLKPTRRVAALGCAKPPRGVEYQIR